MVASVLPVAMLGAVPAQAMTAEDFLTRAQALKAKGMMAIFQKKEINVLVEEIKAVTLAYKADYEKKPPGDASLGCPPPPNSKAAKDKKNRMSTDEFLGSFAAIPKEQRQRTSVKTVFYDLMRTRYPCGK